MPELQFKGKEFVYNHHLTVPFRPLVMHADKGIGAPRLDGNLIIQGDNLEALKALLPLYAGKVDCIFIDPPYNTGNEGWSYNDKVNSPMIREWLSNNPIGIEDGLRHDKWCAMMWPRLQLLRELLSETGSIWITLDDNEIHRAKLILDDMFGEDRFIANLIWEKTTSARNDARQFSADHDHILVYSKTSDAIALNRIERTTSAEAAYTNPDNDLRGPWREGDYKCAKSADERPNLYYPIKNPLTGEDIWPRKSRVWAYSKEETQKNIAENRLWWGKTGNYTYPKLKRFRSDAPSDLVPRTLWRAAEVEQTRTARTQLQAIFAGENPFPTPKPFELIKRVVELATSPDSIVLDSFAGSGTTAHAVLAANKRDGGNRRFILVEMEHYADTLTAERVRRVINGYGFKGTQRTELLRESLNWRALTNADKIVRHVEAIENLHGHEYDRIRREVKDGELIVTGEKTVTERAEGLGGSFTYCTLGPAVEMDAILSGKGLPDIAAIAGLLWHTATATPLAPDAIAPQPDIGEGVARLGEHGGRTYWLIYRADLDWLKSADAALSLSKARAIAATAPGNHLVFASARFVSRDLLAREKIDLDYAPLPFALYKLETA